MTISIQNKSETLQNPEPVLDQAAEQDAICSSFDMPLEGVGGELFRIFRLYGDVPLNTAWCLPEFSGLFVLHYS